MSDQPYVLWICTNCGEAVFAQWQPTYYRYFVQPFAGDNRAVTRLQEVEHCPDCGMPLYQTAQNATDVLRDEEVRLLPPEEDG